MQSVLSNDVGRMSQGAILLEKEKMFGNSVLSVS
jgi:hypothetical protein